MAFERLPGAPTAISLMPLLRRDESFIPVIDPELQHVGRVWIDPQYVEPTRALERLSRRPPPLLTLCSPFQLGRCPAGADCRNLHVDRGHVYSIRESLTGLQCSTCCFGHGDAASHRDDFQAILESHPVEYCPVGQNPLRIESELLAFTKYWDRFLKAEKGQKQPPGRPFRFTDHQVCIPHQTQTCRFGVECRFIHICRKYWSQQGTVAEDTYFQPWAFAEHGGAAMDFLHGPPLEQRPEVPAALPLLLPTSQPPSLGLATAPRRLPLDPETARSALEALQFCNQRSTGAPPATPGPLDLTGGLFGTSLGTTASPSLTHVPFPGAPSPGDLGRDPQGSPLVTKQLLQLAYELRRAQQRQRDPNEANWREEARPQPSAVASIPSVGLGTYGDGQGPLPFTTPPTYGLSTSQLPSTPDPSSSSSSGPMASTLAQLMASIAASNASPAPGLPPLLPTSPEQLPLWAAVYQPQLLAVAMQRAVAATINPLISSLTEAQAAPDPEPPEPAVADNPNLAWGANLFPQEVPVDWTPQPSLLSLAALQNAMAAGTLDLSNFTPTLSADAKANEHQLLLSALNYLQSSGGFSMSEQ